MRVSLIWLLVGLTGSLLVALLMPPLVRLDENRRLSQYLDWDITLPEVTVRFAVNTTIWLFCVAFTGLGISPAALLIAFAVAACVEAAYAILAGVNSAKITLLLIVLLLGVAAVLAL